MAFCIVQDHVNGPLLAFIGKKNSNFSAKQTMLSPTNAPWAAVLSYSEDEHSEDEHDAWPWIDSSFVRGLSDVASAGTQEDVLDALQRLFWYEQEGECAGAGTFIFMTGEDATRIDRNPKGAGYSPENPAWQYNDIEYHPPGEELQENIDVWALREFEAGNHLSIREIGEHAVELLEAKGITGYGVLWAGRVGGEVPVIHEKKF